MKQDHKQPVIFGLIIFFLVLLNVYQFFFIPEQFNVARDALFASFKDIFKTIEYLLFGGVYTALVIVLTGWRKNRFFKKHAKQLYPEHAKRRINKLEIKNIFMAKKIKELQGKCDELNATINGTIRNLSKDRE